MPKAILIPADHRKPVEVFETGEDEAKTFREKIFEGEYGIMSFSTLRNAGADKELTLCYDDEGLYNTPLAVNIRAMAIYELMDNIMLHSFTVPLVGNYIAFSTDEEGETIDIDSQLSEIIHGLFPGPRTTITAFSGDGSPGEVEVINSGW